MVDIFMGLPSDLLITIVLIAGGLMAFSFYAMVRSQPVICTYHWKNGYAKDFKTREALGGSTIQLLRGRKALLTLNRTAQSVHKSLGGFRSVRQYYGVEGCANTVDFRDITKTKEAVDLESDTNLIHEVSEGAKEAVSIINEGATASKGKQFMWFLFGGSAFSCILFILLFFMGRLR